MLLNYQHMSFFFVFNLFFVLLVVLHSVFRNDSLISRVRVGMNEKRKGFFAKMK